MWRYGAAGSGRCAVCGGGETTTTLLDRNHCEPKSPGCVGKCPGIFVDDNGNPSGSNAKDLNCNTVVASGGLNDRLVPAIASCVVNRRPAWITYGPGSGTLRSSKRQSRRQGRARKTVTFEVVLEDPDECQRTQDRRRRLTQGTHDAGRPRRSGSLCARAANCGWDMTQRGGATQRHAAD